MDKYDLLVLIDAKQKALDNVNPKPHSELERVLRINEHSMSVIRSLLPFRRVIPVQES